MEQKCADASWLLNFWIFPRKRCTNRVTHIFGESAIRKDIMILKGEQNPKETIKMQIPYTTR